MKRGWIRAGCLVVWAIPALHAQFQLYLVSGGAVTLAPMTYNLGAVNTSVPITAQFRLLNTSAAQATFDTLKVAGVGFTLVNPPALPVSLGPQASADFTVGFEAASAGSYSAVLSAENVSILLTVTALPSLTYSVAASGGPQLLSPTTGVNFGTALLGSAVTLHFSISNQTAAGLIVPAIAVQGFDFALAGASPSGALLQSQQSAAFDVQFAPIAVGPRNGSLQVGNSAYMLTGTGGAPPLPAPQLIVTLAQPQSDQQGAVAVTLEAAAQTTGSGTVTLAFTPAPTGAKDSTIQFVAGGQTVSFTVSPGDTQGHFGGQLTAPFQTGTTAGALVIAVQLGNATAQQTVVIAPAAVAITAAMGARASGSITLTLTGYDNTRTAGALTFMFFDASGNPVMPGAIQANVAPAFTSYFQASTLAGTFQLTAVFPVTGDTSVVSSFEVGFANSAGSSTTARTQF
jgi:hypothetical protein